MSAEKALAVLRKMAAGGEVDMAKDGRVASAWAVAFIEHLLAEDRG